MQQALQILKPEEYFIKEEPYYESVGDEIAVFEAVYRNGLPVLLKEPTGCGKTRFHPLADDRRVLPMEKAGELLAAARRFLSCHLLQSGLLKRAQGPQAEHAPALRSPGVRLPGGRVGARILEKETGVAPEQARQLVKFAHMTRNLKGQGLDGGASTRLLVHAAKLIVSGVAPVTACRSAIAQALTDDADMLKAVYMSSVPRFSDGRSLCSPL